MKIPQHITVKQELEELLSKQPWDEFNTRGSVSAEAMVEVLARRLDFLEARVRELEKHSHEPVGFVEDKNGFLKPAKARQK